MSVRMPNVFHNNCPRLARLGIGKNDCYRGCQVCMDCPEEKCHYDKQAERVALKKELRCQTSSG